MTKRTKCNWEQQWLSILSSELFSPFIFYTFNTFYNPWIKPTLLEMNQHYKLKMNCEQPMKNCKFYDKKNNNYWLVVIDWRSLKCNIIKCKICNNLKYFKCIKMYCKIFKYVSCLRLYGYWLWLWLWHSQCFMEVGSSFGAVLISMVTANSPIGWSKENLNLSSRLWVVFFHREY